MVAAELCCNKKGGLEIHKPNLMRMHWEIHVLLANTKHHGVCKHFCVSVPQFHNFILKNLQRLSVKYPKVSIIFCWPSTKHRITPAKNTTPASTTALPNWTAVPLRIWTSWSGPRMNQSQRKINLDFFHNK